MKTRYQIFVSSTYNDLKEERDQVIKACLEMGHIPVGMEMFSAADMEQWRIITSHIDDSDYFMVVVGNRYGSMVNGISYTEMEYDYAISKGIPILGFVIDPKEAATWPVDRSDIDKKARQKLQSFKKKVQTKPVSYWKNKDELHGQCAIALTKIIYEQPRLGWIKGRISLENSEINKLYSPKKVFEPTTDSSIEFNKDLTQELKKSEVFFFKGISGKRCAIRVKLLKNTRHDLQLKFIIPHPFKNDKLLADRVSHRMRASNVYNYSEELNVIKRDIPMSIVSLWNIRYQFSSCEIVFQKDTTISRLEIFDNAAYLTLYDSNQIDRQYHPPIVKYSRNSNFYSVHRKEFKREFDISGTGNNKLSINRDYSKENLINDFKRLGLGELTNEKIESYIEQFTTFETEFLTQHRL